MSTVRNYAIGTQVLLTWGHLYTKIRVMLGWVPALKNPHQRLFVVTLLSQATASSVMGRSWRFYYCMRTMMRSQLLQ